MVIEITAARMIAPHVGNSLFTWTSMIGIVLLGVSIGNIYGGRIADKRASKSLVSSLLWIAGIVTLSTPLFVNVVGPLVRNSQNHYLFQTIATSFIFFLPSFIIGSISPVIAKLALTNLKHSGNIVGNLYAVGAIGSIVGTYITGFFLITIFGLQFIIVAVAVVFFLTATAFSNPLKLFKMRFLIILFAATTLGAISLNPALACDKDTNYYCIKILKSEKDPNIIYLQMDQLLHSATNLNDPLDLVFEYTQTIGTIVHSLPNPPQNSLFLGGGGYTLPRYFVSAFPGSNIDVVEIDPEVTQIAYEKFDVPTNTSITTYNTDGRVFLAQLENKRYDIIIGDAFSDAAVAHHLTTQEFNRLVKDHLTEDGYYIINVIDTADLGLFINSYVYTLLEDFKFVYAFRPSVESKNLTDKQNIIVASGNNPIDYNLVGGKVAELIFDSTKQERLNDSRLILLTDDHAPTDILLNPI